MKTYRVEFFLVTPEYVVEARDAEEALGFAREALDKGGMLAKDLIMNCGVTEVKRNVSDTMHVSEA